MQGAYKLPCFYPAYTTQSSYNVRSLEMSITLTFALLSVCGGWALWQFLLFVRSRIASAHLLRIKGPEALSVWTGTLHERFSIYELLIRDSVGNLKQFYARGAAEWQRQLSRQYGSLVKLNGFLGVRRRTDVCNRRLTFY